MKDTCVSIKVMKDGAEKFSLEGDYFMGVIVKVRKVEEGREVECNFAELGSASAFTRIKAIDCLSEEIKGRKRDVVLSSSDILPDLLEMLIKAKTAEKVTEKEVNDGDSQ